MMTFNCQSTYKDKLKVSREFDRDDQIEVDIQIEDVECSVWLNRVQIRMLRNHLNNLLEIKDEL